jgi:toxin ParE1/3/4
VLDVGMKRNRRAIIWSPQAEKDLLDIWQHIAERSSVTADEILCDIEAACVALAAWPQLGSSRDHVREGLRARRVDRYVVFYRAEKKGIAIVRVLHERRDECLEQDCIVADQSNTGQVRWTASEAFAFAEFLQSGLALILEDLVEELVRFVDYGGHATIILHGTLSGTV